MNDVTKLSDEEITHPKPESPAELVERLDRYYRNALGGADEMNRKTPKLKPVRCARCNRFMSVKDLDEGHCDFTPDTAFTPEKIEWVHKRCQEKP